MYHSVPFRLYHVVFAGYALICACWTLAGLEHVVGSFRFVGAARQSVRNGEWEGLLELGQESRLVLGVRRRVVFVIERREASWCWRYLLRSELIQFCVKYQFGPVRTWYHFSYANSFPVTFYHKRRVLMQQCFWLCTSLVDIACDFMNGALHWTNSNYID